MGGIGGSLGVLVFSSLLRPLSSSRELFTRKVLSAKCGNPSSLKGPPNVQAAFVLLQGTVHAKSAALWPTHFLTAKIGKTFNN